MPTKARVGWPKGRKKGKENRPVTTESENEHDNELLPAASGKGQQASKKQPLAPSTPLRRGLSRRSRGVNVEDKLNEFSTIISVTERKRRELFNKNRPDNEGSPTKPLRKKKRTASPIRTGLPGTNDADFAENDDYMNGMSFGMLTRQIISASDDNCDDVVNAPRLQRGRKKKVTMVMPTKEARASQNGRSKTAQQSSTFHGIDTDHDPPAEFTNEDVHRGEVSEEDDKKDSEEDEEDSEDSEDDESEDNDNDEDDDEDEDEGEDEDEDDDDDKEAEEQDQASTDKQDGGISDEESLADSEIKYMLGANSKRKHSKRSSKYKQPRNNASDEEGGRVNQQQKKASNNSAKSKTSSNAQVDFARNYVPRSAISATNPRKAEPVKGQIQKTSSLKTCKQGKQDASDPIQHLNVVSVGGAHRVRNHPREPPAPLAKRKAGCGVLIPKHTENRPLDKDTAVMQAFVKKKNAEALEASVGRVKALRRKGLRPEEIRAIMKEEHKKAMRTANEDEVTDLLRRCCEETGSAGESEDEDDVPFMGVGPSAEVKKSKWRNEQRVERLRPPAMRALMDSYLAPKEDPHLQGTITDSDALSFWKPWPEEVAIEARLMLEGLIATGNAYPGTNELTELARQCIVVTRRQLAYEALQRDPRELLECFNFDIEPNFVACVKDGVSKFRGDIKDKAIAIVAEKYLFHPRKQLPKSKEVEHISRKIISLIGTGLNAKSLSHAFHRGAPLENGVPANYQHPIILAMLKKCFFGIGSGKLAEGRYKNVFNPIPLPLIALILTMVFVALHEWRTGVRIKCRLDQHREFWRELYSILLRSLKTLHDDPTHGPQYQEYLDFLHERTWKESNPPEVDSGAESGSDSEDRNTIFLSFEPEERELRKPKRNVSGSQAGSRQKPNR